MQGICNSLAQYNQSDAKIKNATQYRKQILKKIEEYVVKQEHINNIIVVGNLN